MSKDIVIDGSGGRMGADELERQKSLFKEVMALCDTQDMGFNDRMSLGLSLVGTAIGRMPPAMRLTAGMRCTDLITEGIVASLREDAEKHLEGK